MTVQTVPAGSGAHYGMAELRELYRRYATIALVIAVLAHLGAIGCYYVAGILFPDVVPPRMGPVLDILRLGPPPSIVNSDATPQVQLAAPSAKVSAGVPVPVPDPQVKPDQTIASQRDLGEIPAPATGTGTETGDVQPPPELRIEDEDPPIFQAVELQPVPVKVVTPDYPDIARRAGMEGTVVVRILVDKQGKAKKALVMKSNEDAFNDSALKAAMQFVFTPAMMNNGPVAVWVTLPFHFRLNR